MEKLNNAVEQLIEEIYRITGDSEGIMDITLKYRAHRELQNHQIREEPHATSMITRNSSPFGPFICVQGIFFKREK